MTTPKTKKHAALRDFFACYRPYLKTLVPILLAAVLATAAALSVPLFIRYITDGRAAEANALVRVALLMLLVIAVQVLLGAVVDYCGHALGARMERDLRARLYRHMLSMPVSFFEKNRVGTLLSRLTNDLAELAELFHHMPEDVILYFLRLIGAAVILFAIHPQMTLIVFVLLPPMLVFTLFFSARMRKACDKSYGKIGEVNAEAEDMLSGVRVLKAFTAEGEAVKRFEKANESFYRSRKTIYGNECIVYSGTDFFISLAPVLLTVVGGYAISGGTLTLSELITFLLYVGYITTPVQHLIHTIGQFQNGFAGFTRCRALLMEKPDMPDGTEAAAVRHGAVSFQDVTFAYDTSVGDVLENITFTAEPGEQVAVVGRSGAGKTTLLSLLPRFYDVLSGSVIIDGRDVRRYTLDALRRGIGVVEQTTYLFSGTVAENIAFGCPGADRDRIIEAAKRANAHEFITALENGYDTEVGERGVRLSGGQRQRISIARVFLKDPPILVLDEATSALDSESEQAVHAALGALAKSRTTFIIAHRLSTVRGADKILVLSARGVAQTGTHESLMQQDGVYRMLYEGAE